MSMSSALGQVWTEHKTSQGRAYWYHIIEKRSVWEKPAELKSARESALDSTPWKEYKSGDKSYYVHSITKQSTWTLPQELKQILDQYPEHAPNTPVGAGSLLGLQSPTRSGSPHVAGSPAHPGSALSPLGTSSSSQVPYSPPGFSPDAASGSGTPLSYATAPTPVARLPTRPTNTSSLVADFDFRGDKAGAEAAFIQLLENTRVDVDWTWETTMRTIITDPLYKALKSIAERKTAFNKYIESLKRKRHEESLARQEQLKPVFKQAMLSDPRIKSYSSFATVRKFLSPNAAIWKDVNSDDEARALFEAVSKEMQQAEAEQEKVVRARNLKTLLSLLKTFEADVYTRWRDAHRTILESQEYAEDLHLKSMDVSDMLMVFGDLMRDIDKDAEEAKKRDVILRKRRERKNREAFKALLQDLKAEGKVHARSTWGQVFPLVKDDDRFLRVVGQAGSSPLDMLYDLVDEIDLELAEQTALVMEQIATCDQKLTASTTEEDFNEWVKGAAVPHDALKQIYSAQVTILKEEDDHRAMEDRRKLERRYRHQIEDLRYAFKKVDPALDLDADYEDVVDRFKHLPEYKDAVQSDAQVPLWAWDKFVRRQKEKEHERLEQQSHYKSGFSGDDSTSFRKRKSYSERRDRRDSHTDKFDPTRSTSVVSLTDDDKHKRVRREDESEPEEGEV